MDYKFFFSHYADSISELLKNVDTNLIKASVNLIANTKKNKNKIYIVGNGGSSSIESHVSVDFTKVAKINISPFNNANLITCFANDYEYENWVVEAIKAYSLEQDLFILISSSGTSKNIVNAAEYCKQKKMNLITLSGFKKNNPLSQRGNINFHVESEEYNFIEMTHHIILLSIVDIFAKKIY